MQKSFEKAFTKDSMLIWSTVAGSVLWIANAIFNLIDADYRAFFINLLYVICLIILCVAEFQYFYFPSYIPSRQHSCF